MARPRNVVVDRRSMLWMAAGSSVLAAAPSLAQAADEQAEPTGSESSPAFSFDTVIDLAREAAAGTFEVQRLDLRAPFADLDYDAYRMIRPRPERRLWHGEHRGFEIDLLPPGMLYHDRVEISVVVDGKAVQFAFDPDLFHYNPDYFPYADGAAPPDVPRDLSYSGFRVHFPISQPDAMDEFLVFQGASYFRAIGRGQLYGLSARGLALGTGTPEGEEFPIFRRFWIYQPEAGATVIRIQALLDSPSVAGAYDFVVQPGAETVMAVRAVLFPRVNLEKPGIAPLTSMFYFDPKSRAGIDDFRNAVHDSSGLKMITGAEERLWRPLDNPPTLQVSAFVDRDPKGFGLVQRERDFARYEDAEARYERRPSGWAAPQGNWGEGAVTLIEIPSPNEFNDNIVAFWQPANVLAAGTAHQFDYRLYWSEQPPDNPPLAQIVATRGGAYVNDPAKRSLIVDFDFGNLVFDRLEPRASTSAGTIFSVTLARLPTDGRVRAALGFNPENAELAEMRLVLVDETGRPASETWLARWTRR
jgi:periplasmic glucans biosynthesis protein